MSKINKVKVDNVIYDIEDAEARELINSLQTDFDDIKIPTKLSELENDDNYIKSTESAYFTNGVRMYNHNTQSDGRKVDLLIGHIQGVGYGGYEDDLYLNHRSSNNVRILEDGTGTLYYKGKEVADKDYVNEQISNIEAGTGYVKNTDYASSDNAGLIKTESYYGLHTSSKNGTLYCEQFSYDEYTNDKDGNCFIGKGTLENVLEAKDYATKDYVDEQISNIEASGGSDLIYGNYDSEIIIGYLVENGVNIPVYRKVFKGEKVANSNLVFDTSNLNIDKVLNIQGSTDRTSWIYPLMRYETSDNYTYAYYMPNDNKLIFTSGTSSWCSTGSVTIILEYIKKVN